MKRKEKLVFEGQIYNLYQWEQELFDGSIALFERIERRPSVTVLTVYENKLVIQKQVQPGVEKEFYSVPGGNTDPGEEVLAAAQRELLEEEGLESTDWEYWLEGGRKTSTYVWANHVYIARNCRKVAEPKLDAGEKIEHLFFTIEEFFELLDHPEFRHKDILAELIQIRADAEKRNLFLTQLGITKD